MTSNSEGFKLHLGTVHEYSHANIYPVGFYYDPLDNKLNILTGIRSKIIHNFSKIGTSHQTSMEYFNSVGLFGYSQSSYLLPEYIHDSSLVQELRRKSDYSK
jgi:hypothetical protein